MTSRTAPLLLLASLLTACAPSAPVLLFDGQGTSPGSVNAWRSLLGQAGIDYVTLGTYRLNHLTDDDLRRHRLLIVPGGNFIEIGNGITPEAARRIQTAVSGGMNYLGMCAGAFWAGNSPANGLNLTQGVRFGFYSLERQNIRKAAVLIEEPNGQKLDQYWEDGPELSGWGEVIARYPDGTPAVTQGRYGKGHIILSGIHPEATEKWRAHLHFRTSALEDNAYAAQLARAALTGTPLPRF